MRFAVHRPGFPAASPRGHGVPRRDVPGRVHISVAGETAGSAPEDGLAIARLPVHLPARRASLARECGTDLLHPPRRLLLQAAHKQPPPGSQDASVQPGLGADAPAGAVPGALRGPGHRPDSQVLNPDHVEPARESVEAFSAQSLRLSVSRARSRAIACLTRVRRFDPRLARASFRWRCLRRPASRTVRPGTRSSWPVDSAARIATPRSMPMVSPLPGAGTGSGTEAKATCQRRPGPGSPGRTSPPAAHPGTSGTAPTTSARAPGRHGRTPGAPPTVCRSAR